MVQTYVASHLERTHGRKFHVGSYIPGFLKGASTFVAVLHCHGVSNTCSSLDWSRDHVDDNQYCEECGGTKCRTASCRRNGCSYGILECSQRIRNFGTTAASVPVKSSKASAMVIAKLKSNGVAPEPPPPDQGEPERPSFAAPVYEEVRTFLRMVLAGVRLCCATLSCRKGTSRHSTLVFLHASSLLFKPLRGVGFASGICMRCMH